MSGTEASAAERETTEQAALVAQRFVALADTLVDDFDVVELLDRLVTDCVDLLDVGAAGLLIKDASGALEVVACSSEASRFMEIFQLEAQQGPCVEAIATGKVVISTDIAQLRERWPRFATAVSDVGYDAVYAFPMRLRDDTIGALNLFNTEGPDLTEFDRGLAQALADIATIGILQNRSLHRASLLAEQLQSALNTRVVVEQAKGVLAEYARIDMGDAFEALRSYARANRIKLSTLAQALVDRSLAPGNVVPAPPSPATS